MKNLRRALAGITLAAATLTGTALTTTAAHADDTATTTVTVDDTIVKPADLVATLRDTWWG